MIKAIVDTGELSDPDDAKYLTDVIIKRRDKVVAYWIGQTNPLDRFAVDPNATGRELTFDNAAIRLRVAPPGVPTRLAGWHSTTPRARRAGRRGPRPHRPRVAIPNEAWGPAETTGCPYAVRSISTIEANHPSWATPGPS